MDEVRIREIIRDEIIKLKPSRITMTVKEAANYLGLSDEHVRAEARKGNIPHVRSGSLYLFRKDTLDEWLSGLEKQSFTDGDIRQIQKDHEKSKHDLERVKHLIQAKEILNRLIESELIILGTNKL